ncbi:MAG: M20 family metallopeptidase [Ruminococcaceae bacterium]|nr:M20 family metallopeptidase [Oscillospiraceae bacterium]
MDALYQWMDAHAAELTEAAARLVRIDSVGAAPQNGHPFGDGVAAALDEALAIAKEWGLATCNHEYYVGTVQLGEGEPRLGVLCHLDTVPFGEGWTFDPLGAVITDGKMYGRGTTDDKGPVAATLFALRALKECGMTPPVACRAVLGGDEETGSTDMEYYQTKEAFPPYLFSPDGSYPLINTEKGRVQLTVSAPMTDPRLLWARGGVALNAVPTEAVACLCAVETATIREAAAKAGHAVTVTDTAEGVTVTAHGAAAHGSTPEKGENAVTALLEVLAALGVGGDAVKAAAKKFPFAEYGGESAGAACSDAPSGALTLALTCLSIEEGQFIGKADIRFPVSFTVADIEAKLHTGLDAAFGVTCDNCVEGHHVPEDSPFVQTLLKVYEQETGEKGYGLAIGGGTYVHGIPNGVAFGVEFPDVDNRIHGADEFIGVDELMKDARLIARAIAAVCAENW